MSRVSLVEASQAPLSSRSFYAKGDPGPIISSMAHVPELLGQAAPFIGAIFGPSAVSARLKEIVVLRTSARLRCRYCIQTHMAVALDAGLSRDEVLALRGEGPAASAFSDPRELALLEWTDALAAGSEPIDDHLSAKVRETFTEPEIVELTLLSGATIMLNRYCTALNLPTSAATLEKLGTENLL
jgi:AhpD family alkylhydroperoxidase